MNKSICNTICKVLSVAVLLLCSVAVWGYDFSGKTIYLTPNNDFWNKDGAWYQLYYYGDGGTGWLTLNQGPESDVYFATIPSGKEYTGIIFLRMKPGAHAKTWDYETSEIWNRSEVTTNSKGQNNYKITGWNNSGTWIDHAYIKKGTRVFFDNSKTQWSEVWLTIVGTLDVNNCKDGNYVKSYTNQSAKLTEYKTYADSWYQMKKYCGNIYYLDLPQDSYREYLSFADKDMFGYDDGKIWAASVILHFKWDGNKPCIHPFKRSDTKYNESYEWSGDLQAVPKDINAEPLSIPVITPSRQNPVPRNETVELTVKTSSDSNAPTWIWYESKDNKNWTKCTSGVSGSKNSTLTIAPYVSTYYKVRTVDSETGENSTCAATYRIESDIPCSGNKMTLLSLDFDKYDKNGNPFTSYEDRREVIPDLGESINDGVYKFSRKGYEILDGWYAILANPYYGGRGTQQSSKDCHTTSCLKPVRTSGDYWYNNIKDHTHGGSGDKIGGMLMANCLTKGEIIYEYTTDKLCSKNLFMTFSVWFANATTTSSSEPLPINAQVKILSKDGAEELAHIDIVDLKSSSDWNKAWVNGRTSFFSGDNDVLKVQIINNGASGTGNDILIDDIEFTACVPNVKAVPGTKVACGEITTITVNSSGIDEIFKSKPYYLWQQYNYETAKWDNIANDPNPSSSSHKGSGIDKQIYEFNILKEKEGVDPKFRVIMAIDEQTAKDVASSDTYVCPNYAMTDDIIVDCKCLEQHITKSSGNENQNVCEGNAIGNVVYLATGTTSGADVKDLPDGLTAAKSGKNVTISGTLPVIDKDTTYTIKVFAVDTPGISCESDTLELKINSKQKPSLKLVEGGGYGEASQGVCKEDKIVDIYYQWGGSATGATASPDNSGITYQTIAGDKEVKISGTPASTYTYTVSTTGQNTVCQAEKLSGTLTLHPTPAEPGVKYKEIK